MEAAVRQRDMHVATLLHVCGDIENDDRFNEWNIEAVRIRNVMLSEAYNRVVDRHERVYELAATEADYEAAGNFLPPIQLRYINAKAKSAARITAEERNAAGAQQQPINAPAVQQQIIHLLAPHEKMEEFDGAFHNWLNFRDVFIAEVHSKPMHEVQKLRILQKACIGKGASALGPWKPIEGNYQLAWQTLCDKYNDDYALKQALVTQIMKIPRCIEDTGKALTVLVETTANSLRQLASMNVPTDQWGELLTGIITWKMPGQMADQWEQKRLPNQEPKFEDLMTFLRQRIRGQARSASNGARTNKRANPAKPAEKDGASEPKKSAPRPSVTPSKAGLPNNRDSRGGSLAADAPRRQFATRGKVTCWKCEGEHYLFDCDQYKTLPLDGRHVLLKELGVCHECGRRHIGDCNQAVEDCKRCGDGVHIQSLCPQNPFKKNAPATPGGEPKGHIKTEKKPARASQPKK